MLDIDSYLRIPSLLIWALNRGRGAEGGKKTPYDLTQTHMIIQHKVRAHAGLEISSRARTNPCGVCTRTRICRSFLAALINIPSSLRSQITHWVTTSQTLRLKGSQWNIPYAQWVYTLPNLCTCSSRCVYWEAATTVSSALWRRLWVEHLAPACFCRALCSSVSTGL